MFLDKLIIQADRVINTLLIAQHPNRESPANKINTNENLTLKDKQLIICLLRVNHCGEICAQALYYGQSMLIANKSHKMALEEAAEQELDHLAWLQQRINELNGQTSILNPIFYILSFSMGVAISLLGNNWNFAFIHETEHQVMKHLNKHISLIPEHDKKSIRILKQMLVDEEQHAENALELGNKTMPKLVATIMNQTAKIMTKTTYYI